jgi:hypothetical protein
MAPWVSRNRSGKPMNKGKSDEKQSFVRIAGSPIVFLICLLLLMVGFYKGWLSYGGFGMGLAVITALGVSSAVTRKNQ